MTAKSSVAADTADSRIISVVTPSGIEVEYQAAPKRRYRVRRHWPNSADIPTEWFEVPSVTTVLEVLDKPGLPWWGMGVGAEGVAHLFNLGLLQGITLHGQQALCLSGIQPVVVGKDELVALLKEHKLTTNHVKDKAGDRGVAVHDALETWARDGVIPDPSLFPPEEQGYIIGLVQFLRDVSSAEPEEFEVMVGSLEYGYAGRYDLRFRTRQPHRVVRHRTPVRGPQYAELPPGRFLLDLKTSKDVYLSHSRQLEAYEKASIECGYEPTDARGILNVSADGNYKFVRSIAEFEDFLCTLDVWRSEQRMKERK